MGIVYKAFDLALERRIAAKVVAERMTREPGAMARFVEEAKNAARLRDHPNVVTVYDFGVIDERQAYLIMELLEGRTLRQQLAAERTIEPHQALRILEDIASAIAAAHRLQLVHRDLKPENIFLVDSGHRAVAKVLDFGIAKPLAVATSVDGRRPTNTRVLLGTLEYMSPEQRRGDAPTKAWDVWSLAVVALEMLSGSPSAPMAAIEMGQWLPGNALVDTMPECAKVFNRALSIDPAIRPPDVDSLVREIAAAVHGERAGRGERGGRRHGSLHMRN
jgi:serine/threonine-protein kinase